MKEIPFAARWIIAEEDLLKLKDSVDYKSLETKYISTSSSSGLKYNLKIYPNGNREANHGKVIIFLGLKIDNLQKRGYTLKVESVYTVRTESANFSHERIAIFEKSSAWGNLYCDTAELFDAERKFIVDGKMVLIVHGIFYIMDDAAEGSTDGLEWGDNKLDGELWTRNDTKDFLIIGSDGKGIKAHKIVLQAQSPVFAAMFRSNMKKEKKVVINDFSYITKIALFLCIIIMAVFNVLLNKFCYLFNYKSKRAMKEAVDKDQVEIMDFSSDVIERALKLVYDYADEFDASPEEAMSILPFLDKYDFKSFKDRIEKFLMKSVGSVYACKLMNCAIKSNALKLKEKCFECLTAALVEKTPIADLEILDKEILLKIVQDSLYQNFETVK